jgi:hypothetical protein
VGSCREVLRLEHPCLHTKKSRCRSIGSATFFVAVTLPTGKVKTAALVGERICGRVGDAGRSHFSDRAHFLIGKLQTLKKPMPGPCRELLSHVHHLTSRDCISILSHLSSKEVAEQKDAHLLLYRTVSRLVAITATSETPELPLVVQAVSRMSPSLRRKALMSIQNQILDQPDSEGKLRAFSLVEVINILNVLSKECQVLPKISSVLLDECKKHAERLDHRTGSNFLRAFVRLGCTESLNDTLARFVTSQREKLTEWTPQSCALFIYSLSKLRENINPSVKNFVADLARASEDLTEFTDQNICNAVVGLKDLGFEADLYMGEISRRGLKKQDLFFLMKSRESSLFELALKQMKEMSISDASVICDISDPKNKALFASSIAKLVPSWIHNCKNSKDLEQLFYILHKLNYCPPQPIDINASAVETLTGSKASRIVVCLQKLDIKLKSVAFLPQLVNRIIPDPPSSSDLAACVFAIAAMPGYPRKCRMESMANLLNLINAETLNAIDKRQLQRANVVLLQEAGWHPCEALSSLVLQINTMADEPNQPDTPSSSRAHAQIVSTLRQICDKRIETEIEVPQISSYIDILVR